jgi:MurNAc alpha-1-phosphate uridylyltransferase
MRPLTDATPKPLLSAGGRPIIEWQVARLVAGGFTGSWSIIPTWER